MTELKHYGVKGMKWGVRKAGQNVKSAVVKTGKAISRHNKKRHARNIKVLTDRHNKYMSNKKYAKDYNKALKRTNNKHQAMRTAQILRRNRSNRNAKVALRLGIVGASAASKFLTKPETIRAGKNFVQAMKNSPIRYVDGSSFTNVVDAAMPLIKR